MNIILTLSAGLLSLVASNANADVYKCRVDGKVTYEETHCGDFAERLIIQKGPEFNNIEAIYEKDGFGYKLDGSINNSKTSFLVDTGASITSIPADLAKNALPGKKCSDAKFHTASGSSDGCIIKGVTISVGTFVVRNVDVAVMQGLKTSLLGMNVISKMGSAKITEDKIVFQAH